MALPLAVAGCVTTLGDSRSSSRPPPPPSEDARLTEPPGTTHLVQPGETLWAIAQKYGSSVEEISEVNGIDNPDELTAGQNLFIPAPDPMAPPSAAPPVAPANPEQLSAPPAGPVGKAPFIWPLDQGVLFQEFGPRHGATHDGIDLGAPEGTPIRAAADGEVLFAGADRGAYGNIIIIRHPDDRVTVYAHNKVNLVKEGDKVKQGQVIGRVGRTGFVESPHLHFELRQRRKPVDPTAFLPPE